MKCDIYRDLYPCSISTYIVCEAAFAYIRNMKAIIGLFSEMDEAETAITRFKEAGFSEEEIGVMARGYLVKDQLHSEPNTSEVAEKAGIGAAVGATAGGLLGLLAAGLAFTVPVLGPMLAAGSLVPILSGATAGAVYGGALGIFLGLDVSENEAQFYVDHLAEDAVMVVVHAEDERAAEALALMRELRPIALPPTQQLKS